MPDLNSLIPEIVSAEVLVKLRGAYVFGQDGVINHDYEGDVDRAGASVRISSIGDISVVDYVRNQDVPTPETLSTTPQDLLIDQAKLAQFYIDDVDAAQIVAKNLLPTAAGQVALNLRAQADSFIAGKMIAAATNTIGEAGTPVTVTATTAYEELVALGVALDDQGVPEDGRWAVVTPEFHGLLQKDDRFVRAADNADPSQMVLKTGRIGEAAGFTILKSPYIPKTAAGERHVVAGTPLATTFADQILQSEYLRSERRVAGLFRALHVYGSQVVRPEGLAVLTYTV